MAASILSKYFRETRHPIYSAALVLPFFVVYHLGTFFLRTTYINGADALIIRLLSLLSVNTMFASVLVLLACFLAWQISTHGSWTIDTPKLMLMFLDSIVYAVLLLFLFGWLLTHSVMMAPRAAPAMGSLAKLALYCGAGIYEELVFRGFLLGGLLMLFKKAFRMKSAAGTVLATLLTAMLFSLFHYIGPAGDPFTLGSFLQRAIAGVYFSAVFVGRGFGVAAASHAIYDILVGLIL
jgi:membrane protease YdiL (CAAX protease family)